MRTRAHLSRLLCSAALLCGCNGSDPYQDPHYGGGDTTDVAGYDACLDDVLRDLEACDDACIDQQEACYDNGGTTCYDDDTDCLERCSDSSDAGMASCDTRYRQ